MKQTTKHQNSLTENLKATLMLGLTLTWTLFPTGVIIAAPTGEQVVSGNADFLRDGLHTQITAADNTIINYQSFDIAALESVQFIQPGANASVLNRITGSANPTQILGTLTANGQIYLVNPAGITFGQGSMLDVGALFAVAGNMTDEDYLNGLNRFSGLEGRVENFGTIQSNGMTALLGRSVANFGTLVSAQDHVVMASGEHVYLGERDGHVFVEIATPQADATTGVENAGSVSAPQGDVVMASGDALGLAILQSGWIEAKNVAIEGQGTGTVQIDGDIAAADSVHVTGETLMLQDDASITAGDANGGGEILIGGDQEGLNPEVRNASNVFVGSDVTLSADARISGQGGKLIVYADQQAIILGTLSARGAPDGNGGFVETSGKEYLVVAKAPEIGAGGTWLIDPNNIEIVADGTIGVPLVNSENVDESGNPTFVTTDDTARIEVDLLEAALLGGTSVVVTTGTAGADTEFGNITLTANLDYDTRGNGTLIFNAANDIIINGTVTDGSGAGDSLNFTLNADTDLTGSGDVSINSTVDLQGGVLTVTGQSFSLNSDLNAGSVLVTGETQLGGNVTTTGAAGVDLGGNALIMDGLTIDTSTGNGTVSFGGTVDSQATETNDLTVDAGSGAVTFAGAVGSTDALGAVSLNSTGTTDLQSTVAATSLATNAGGTTQLGGNVTTTGASGVNVGDNALIMSGLTIDSTTGNGTVSFDGTVNSEATETNGLTVDAGSGAVTFAGAVGSTDALGAVSLNSTGTTDLQSTVAATSLATNAGGTTQLGGNVTTSGAAGVNVGENALIMSGLTIDSTTGNGTVSFGGTVNSEATETNDLTVNAGSGAVTFVGAVGSTDALGAVSLNSTGTTDLQSTVAATSLATNAGGTTQLGGNVTTTGAAGVDVGDNALIMADLTIDSSAGNGTVSFDGTVNSEATETNDLTVDAGSGAVTFAGAVGSTDALGAVSLNSTGTTDLQSTVAATSLATNAGGTTVINGGAVTTSGATGQVYNDAVTLGADTTLNAGAGAINLASTVDGAHSLTANTTGTTTLGGVVGGGTALTSLTTNAGGTTVINGGAVTTSGATGQVYNDAVTLGADTTLNAGAGAINLASTVDGAHSLTANTTGTTTLGGVVGGGTALTSLTTNAGGTTVINGGAVTTSGATGQVYNDAVTLGADTTLNAGAGAINLASTVDGAHSLTANTTGTTTLGGVVGGGTALTSLTTNAGGTTVINGGAVTTSGATGQVYNDAVTLGADTTLNAGAGAINLASTVDGAHSLTANTTGTTTLGGVVGGGTALTSLTTNAGGTTVINGGTVTTSGATGQVYNDAVTLGADTTLNAGAGAINLASTVDGAHSLTANTTGTTTLGGVVGGGTALTSLTTNAGGTTVINGGAVTTSGATGQVYNDAVTLGADTTLNAGAGAINLASTVDGAHSLTANTTGTTTLGGAVGGGTALTSLTTNAGGTTAINGGTVTTSGATGQVYNDAVTLGADTTLNAGAGAINLVSTVDGAHSLTANTTGTTTLGGAVGGGTALTSLTTNAGGTTQLGGNVTTSGAAGVNLGNNALIMSGLTIDSTTGNGTVSFGGTVNSEAAETNALTVNAGSGAVTFAGAVGSTDALNNLDVTAGATSVAADIKTSGNQTYSGDFTSSSSTITLTAGTGNTITFEEGRLSPAGDTLVGLINLVGNLVLGTNSELFVNLEGTAPGNFDQVDVTGDADVSASFTVQGTAVPFNVNDTFEVVAVSETTTDAGGASSTTISSQGFDITYNSVTLTRVNTSFTWDGGGADDFWSTALNWSTDVRPGQGDSISFAGSARTNNQNDLLNAVNQIEFSVVADPFTLSGNDLQISGGVVNSSSSLQTININLTLTADQSFNSIPAGGGLVFGGTVDGAFDLGSNVGTNGITFAQAIGGTTPLSSLTVSAANQVDLANVSTTGAIAVTGTNIDLNGTTYQSDDGNIGFTGALDLDNATISIDSDANDDATDGDISFSSTVDGASDLTLDADTGDVAFSGLVGDTARLGEVVINSVADLSINGMRAASFDQQAGSGDTTFNNGTFTDASVVALQTNAETSVGSGVGINVLTDGKVLVDGLLATENGPGGLLRIGSGVTVNVKPEPGEHDIVLNDGGGTISGFDTFINTKLGYSNMDLVITALRDVIIQNAGEINLTGDSSLRIKGDSDGVLNPAPNPTPPPVLDSATGGVYIGGNGVSIENGAISITGNTLLDNRSVDTGAKAMVTPTDTGIYQNSNIRVTGTGTIDVEAYDSGITMASGTVTTSNGGNIRYAASGNIALGLLDAGSGDVSVLADYTLADTANLLSGSTTVTVADTTVLSVGMLVTGAGIPDGTTVASITDATTFELNQSATATAVDESVTYLANISEATAGNNIAADYLRLEASGSVGSAGAGNALDTSVATVGSKSGADTYLLEADTVTVDDTIDGINNFIRVQRVGLDSSLTATDDAAFVRGGESGGVYKLETTNGSITVAAASVAEAIQAGSHILLRAKGAGSDLTLAGGADVVSTGAGNISLLAQDAITQNADVTTDGGTVDVEAFDGSITMASGTVTTSNGGNIRYAASGNIALGLLDAGSGDVSVLADYTLADTANLLSGSTTVTVADTTVLSVGMLVTGAGIPDGTTVASITDATTFELNQSATATAVGESVTYLANISEATAGNNIAADYLRLEASGSVGSAGAGNALDTSVATVGSKSGADTYLLEADTVTVDDTIDGINNFIRVQRVGLDSSLTATDDAAFVRGGESGGVYKLETTNGSITVAAASVAEAIQAGSHILLRAKGAGSDLTLAGGADVVSTGAGNISLLAQDAININSDESDADPANWIYADVTTQGGMIDVEAFDGSITMASGTVTTSNGGNIRYAASGDIALGLLDATVDLSASFGSGSKTVTVADTSGLVVGTSVTGPGVPEGVTVASITNATTFELSEATTAAGAAVSVTLLGDVSVFTDDGDILEATAGNNIAADYLRLEATGSIGDGANNDASDQFAGVNALDIDVATVGSKSGSNTYLLESDAITVDDTGSAGITVERVNLDSTTTTIPSVGTFDNVALNRGGESGGVYKLETTDGAITVASNDDTVTYADVIRAVSHILLKSGDAGDDAAWDVTQNADADIVSTGSDAASLDGDGGNISILADGSFLQNADVTTDGGTIDVEAFDSSITMASGTVTDSNGGNIRYAASGDIALGLLDATVDLSANFGSGSTTVTVADTSGLVVGTSVTGPGVPEGVTVASITDATTFELSEATTAAGAAVSVTLLGDVSVATDGGDILESTAGNNVAADYLRLEASGSIGDGANGSTTDLLASDALDIDVATIGSKSGTNTYLLEANGVTVDDTIDVTNNFIRVQRVGLDSSLTATDDAALPRGGEADGVYKLETTNGSITVAAASVAEAIQAGSHILLRAKGAGSDLTLAGGADVVSTGAGNISLLAQDTININSDESDADPANWIYADVTTQGGMIDVEAFDGSITMASGTVTTSNGGNIRYAASGDIALGLLDATVDLSASFGSGSKTVTVADTSGLVVGTSVTGPGVPEGVTVASITNATTFELSEVTTAAGAAVSVTLLGDVSVFTDDGDILEATAGNNIAADYLRLEATGSIGDGANNDASDQFAGVNALDIDVKTVGSKSGSNTYLLESDAITVDDTGSAGITVQRVDLASNLTPTAPAGTLDNIALVRGGEAGGVYKLETTNGSITVAAASVAAAIQAGSHILLRAKGAGSDLTLAGGADVVSTGAGNISLLAQDTININSDESDADPANWTYADVTTQGGTVDVEAFDGSITMASGTVTTSNGGNIRYAASGDIALGLLNAWNGDTAATTDEHVTVFTDGGNIIESTVGNSNSNNIAADYLRLEATGSIGDGANNDASDQFAGVNALDIDVKTVGSKSGSNTYLLESDAITVDDTGSAGITVQRVDLASNLTPTAPAGTLDNIALVRGGEAGGVYKLETTNGSITVAAASVAAAIQAGSHILLRAKGAGSDLTLAGGADVVSTGAGNISLLAQDTININSDESDADPANWTYADVTTQGGTVDVEAFDGSITMASGTVTTSNGGNIRYAASGDIALGLLNAWNGDTAATTDEHVTVFTDGGNIIESTVGNSNSNNIAADYLRLEATGSIGDGANNDASDQFAGVNALDIDVKTVGSKSGSNTYLLESDAITVDDTGSAGITVQRVDLASNLTPTAPAGTLDNIALVRGGEAGGVYKLETTNGSITVAAASVAAAIQAGSHILLRAKGAGSDLTLAGGADVVSTGAGNISLLAQDTININSDESDADPANWTYADVTTQGGTVDVEAFDGSITMASGTVTTSNGGNIRYAASGDIALGLLNAWNGDTAATTDEHVTVFTDGGNIIESTVGNSNSNNIAADYLRLEATGSIGDGANNDASDQFAGVNALDIDVKTVGSKSGSNTYLLESDAITVDDTGSAGITVQRVDLASNLTPTAPAGTLDNIALVRGGEAGGVYKLETTNGSITVAAASVAAAIQAGSHILLRAKGAGSDLTLAGGADVVSTGAGNISLLAQDTININSDESDADPANWTYADVTTQGGTVDVEAFDGSITMASGTVTTSNGGNIRYAASGDIALGLLNAWNGDTAATTDEHVTVFTDGGNIIESTVGNSNSNNIAADYLRLEATGSIGDGANNDASDQFAGVNALDIDVKTVGSKSGSNTYLLESDAITVDDTGSAGITVQRVDLASNLTPTAPAGTLDNIALVRGGEAGGVYKLETTNGSITVAAASVAAAIQAGSHILLRAKGAGSDLTLAGGADVVSTGAGNISLLAQDTININSDESDADPANWTYADVTTQGGTVDVEAFDGSITMASGTVTTSNGGNIRYAASGDIALGLLNAWNGDTAATTDEHVTVFTDGGNIIESTVGNSNSNNIAADYLRLEATGSIGDGANNDASDQFAGVNALDIDVKTVGSKSGSNTYLLESDAITVDDTGSAGITVQRVDLASNLTPTAPAGTLDNIALVRGGEAGGVYKLETTNGSITVAAASVAAAIQAGSHILLRAKGAGSDLTLAGGADVVSTGAGNISLLAQDTININSDESDADPANWTYADVTTQGGTVDVEAFDGSITMASGTVTTSNGGNIRYAASGDIALGLLNAWNGDTAATTDEHVTVFTDGGNIIESTVGNSNSNNIAADYLRLEATGSIGDGANNDASDQFAGVNALDIDVKTVGSKSGSNTYLLESDAITVDDTGSAGITVQRVDLASNLTPTAPAGTLDNIALVRGGEAGGVYKLETTNGSITVAAASVAAAIQAGSHILLRAKGAGSDLTLAGGADVVSTGAGNISLLAQDTININSDESDADPANWTYADVTTQGGTVDVEAFDGSITMASGTVTTSNGGNIRYAASGDIALGLLNAWNGDTAATTDEHVTVFTDGGNIIESTVGNSNSNNIAADYLRLEATGSIGDGANNDASDQFAGVNALDIDVKTVGSKSGSNTYLLESDAITVDDTGSAGITVQRVDLASNLTPTAPAGTLDNIALVRGGEAGGVYKLETTNGSITVAAASVAAAIQAGSHILLRAKGAGSDLTLAGGADVVSTGAGNISLLAQDTININSDESDADPANWTYADVTTQGGTVDVEAFDGSITMASGTVTTSTGGNIRYAASGDIALGLLNAWNGDTAATTDEHVTVFTDGGNIIESTVGNSNSNNIAADYLRLEATGSIGDGANNDASDQFAGVNALDIDVKTVGSKSGSNTYLLESDAITVDDTGSAGITVQRVDLASNLTPTAPAGTLDNIALVRGGEAGGVYKLETTNGSITVAAASVAEAIQAGSHILLRAKGAGSDLTLAGGADVVSTGAGNISLLAQDTININSDESDADPANWTYADVTTQGGTVDVEAFEGSITMADGTVSLTNGGNIRYAAIEKDLANTTQTQNVTLSLLDARTSADRVGDTLTDQANWGDVSVKAGNNVIDARGDTVDAEGLATIGGDSRTENIYASGLQLDSGGDVGILNNPIDTEVGTMAAQSGGSFYVYESTDLRLDVVSFAGINRVGLDSTLLPSLGAVDLNNLTAGSNLSIAYGQSNTSDLGGEYRLVLNNTEFKSASGDITITANRQELMIIDDVLGSSNKIADATIYNAGTGSVAIIADGDVEFGKYEKLTVGNAATPETSNLTIEAGGTMKLADIAVSGDLNLTADTIQIVERNDADMPSRDSDTSILPDLGTDIVVKGAMTITANRLEGTNGGSIQNIIGVGADSFTLNDAINLGTGVIVGFQVADEIFTVAGSNTFDYIADPAFSTFPYNDEVIEIEVEPDEDNVSDALREELLKLRIFARDMTPSELGERKNNGYHYIEQLIVDSSAPISDYQVAVSRISPAAAQLAVDSAKAVIGEEGEGLESISEVLTAAYQEFLSLNADGDPEQFAQYLQTASTPATVEAVNATNQLVQLLEQIEVIGVTETEAGISRKNILSRLRIEGLRGRDLLDFFDTYRTSSESLLTANNG